MVAACVRRAAAGADTMMALNAVSDLAFDLARPTSALAIVVANAQVDVVSVRPRYRSCPNGHLWSPGGPLKLSTKVCPTCGWLDERAFDGGDR